MPSWSESSLGAHAILLGMSQCSSYSHCRFMLSRQWITKTLGKLQECTGCSTCLLLAYGLNGFCNNVVHIMAEEPFTCIFVFMNKKMHMICKLEILIWKRYMIFISVEQEICPQFPQCSWKIVHKNWVCIPYIPKNWGTRKICCNHPKMALP